MTPVVIDASVALKWAVPSREPLTDESLRLLRRYVAGEIEFVVPELFWVEIGDVLYRGIRQHRWKRDDAEAAAAELRSYDFETVSCSILLPEALQIALDANISIYDCFYVVLAMQGKTELITADERLANALGSRFPVKWLGAF